MEEEGVGEGGRDGGGGGGGGEGSGGDWRGKGAALWKTPLDSHLKAPLGLIGSMLLIPVYFALY